jgi:molybdopterin synthase catalytic subunit
METSVGPRVFAELRAEPLSVDECLAAVTVPEAGGTALFIGTVRDHDGGRSVVELEYLAHPLAARELAAVAHAVASAAPGDSPHDGREQHAHEHHGDPHGPRLGVRAVAVLHRTGRLAIGDVAVVCAVSAAHRAEAFAACRRLIDETKSRVPIWKRQLFTDGTSEWVGAC